MKKLFTILLFLNFVILYAQNMGINTTTPHQTAMLDVVSNNKGFLPPRMSAAARDSIVSPANGLIIYCTTSNCLNFFNGTSWMELCGTSAPSAFVCGASFTDTRDGKVYTSKLIGGKCWMAKSLAYNAAGSIAGTGALHPDTVGRYYLWTTILQGSPPMDGATGTIKGVCPNGWHLPTKTELDALSTAVTNDGNALKRQDQGTGLGQGTNTSGFSMILAGKYNGLTSTFDPYGTSSYIWSCTEGSTTARSYYQALIPDDIDIYVIQSPFANLYYNVRCIKD
jgi:uncharacterized protein (TIGR02145 family)